MAMTTITPIVSREAYSELLQILEGDGEFPRTYEMWQEQTERTKLRAQSQGRSVTEVTIEPNAFVRYCAAIGQSPSVATLGAYAVAEAGRR